MRVPIFSMIVVMVVQGCRTAPSAPEVVMKAPPDEVLALQAAQTRSLEWAASLSDTAGPRFSGSEGERRGVAWALATMNALGLANVHTEPVVVPHWVRGKEEVVVTAPVVQALTVVALGHSGSTPEAGVEGEVVEVTTLDGLNAVAAGSLVGKVLFVNVPMRRTVDGSGYGEVARVRRLAGQKAQAAGAVGSLIRSVGTDGNRLGHTGSQGAEPPTVPSGALAIPDAELLHRLVARGEPVRVRVTLRSVELEPVESANVVGEVVGREVPSEVVVLGAHLDSWDLGTGALDDAAGVGVVLDVARLVKGMARAPRRTVRVVLFANEENGLAGARAYAKAHEGEASSMALAMEADLGSDAARSVRWLGGEGAGAVIRSWAGSLAPLKVTVEGGDGEGGADLSTLRALGVPVLDVRQDATRYFDFHHTANDTVDKLDGAQLAQVTRAFVTVAWLAAEERADFGRVAVEKRERRR